MTIFFYFNEDHLCSVGGHLLPHNKYDFYDDNEMTNEIVISMFDDYNDDHLCCVRGHLLITKINSMLTKIISMITIFISYQ